MKPLNDSIYDFYASLISQQLKYYKLEEVNDFYHNTFLWSIDDTHNFDLRKLKTKFNNTNNSKLKIVVAELEKTIYEDNKLKSDLSSQLNFF